jgi:hypothetical protein
VQLAPETPDIGDRRDGDLPCAREGGASVGGPAAILDVAASPCNGEKTNRRRGRDQRVGLAGERAEFVVRRLTLDESAPQSGLQGIEGANGRLPPEEIGVEGERVAGAAPVWIDVAFAHAAITPGGG